MRKLTGRELSLVYTAFLMTICCIGFWAVRSTSYAAFQKAGEELEGKRMEAILAETDQKTEYKLEAGILDHEQYFTEHIGVLEPLMAEHAMEQMFLWYPESNQLTVLSTEVEAPVPNPDIKDAVSIYTGIVRSVIRGSMDGICGMLAELGQADSLGVDQFKLTKDENGFIVELTVEIYMVNRQEVQTPQAVDKGKTNHEKTEQ